jgi:uncharacterized protein YbaP (TraB family)
MHTALAACVDKADYVPFATQSQDSLLYAVHHCESGQVNYVFGTLHTSDTDIMQRIAFILPYVAKARHAWFEIINSPQDQATLQQMMLIPVGNKTLDTMLPATKFAAMVKRFTDKNPLVTAELLSHYKPWAAAIALQVLEIDMSGMVMDEYVQDYAKRQGVEIHALETARAQLQIFEDLSHPEQIQLLESAINDYDKMADFTGEMLTHYKARQLKEVATVAQAALHMQQDALSHKLEQRLLHDRNHHMTKRLLPEFAKGNVFVAVGALHLTGETGILTQCEDAGYQITPVLAH